MKQELHQPNGKESVYKAQFGEDRLLSEYFGHKSHGFYVEVGALDGVYASNTYYFEHIGWRGILIEANPKMAEKCLKARPGSEVIACAVSSPQAPNAIPLEIVEGWEALSSTKLARERFHEYQPAVQQILVPTRTLDSIFNEHMPEQIDFITIDVEGHEWEVLQGLTMARWQPEIVIIERWGFRPQPQIMSYMDKNGYVYMRTTGGINDWFRLAGYRGLTKLAYKIRLGLRLYLPCYFLEYAKRFGRAALKPLGLLEFIRALRNRRR